jgi:NAD(P)-dependent dehydrogenase (short-subunit alcohol dehydrogenase family)
MRLANPAPAGHHPRGEVDMDEFAGRVAVITGGGNGIGAAMARAFAARGARLVLADLDPAAMERVAKPLTAAGTEVLCVPTDVGELAQVQALADAAERRFGAVHLVCNNAGVALFGEMAAQTHADWVYTMRVNFWGVVHGVETFVPRLLAGGAGGHVVNTASMAGLVGMRWLGIYSASKFAVVGLTEALHRELADHGIGVSVLCPMVVQTDINQNSVRNRPAALRNPGAPDAVAPAADAMAGSTIPAGEVARRVVRGIERKDLYILTHPEQQAILRRRAARQQRMFEPGVW